MKTVFFSRTPVEKPELTALKEELQNAREDLLRAYQQFNEATDPELVDACVYQISAVNARCNYLIRSIKTLCPASAEDEEDSAWM